MPRFISSMREHGGGGLALIPTAPEVPRNRDTLYPYRHDSYFYYLAGFQEPEAVVALAASARRRRHILFCREKNEEREIWDGFRYGPERAREIFGFDEAHPIAELRRALPELLATSRRCSRRSGCDELGPAGERGLNEVRARARTGCRRPTTSSTCAARSTRCASSRTPTRST